MHIIRYPSKSALKSLALVLSLLLAPWVGTTAQGIHMNHWEAFMQAPALYIINSAANTAELTTTSGEVISLITAVHEAWPEKKIIVMDWESYEALDDVKKLFTIGVERHSVSSYGAHSSFSGGYETIHIQKGKLDYDKDRSLYKFPIAWGSISSGVLPERLLAAVRSMKQILVDAKDESLRNSFFYKKVGLEELLSTRTLYFRRDDLEQRLLQPDAIRSFYRYAYEICSDEEWSALVSGVNDKAAYAEFIPGGDLSAISVYDAADHILIVSSFPWVRTGAIGERFFKEVLGKKFMPPK